MKIKMILKIEKTLKLNNLL